MKKSPSNQEGAVDTCGREQIKPHHLTGNRRRKRRVRETPDRTKAESKSNLAGMEELHPKTDCLFQNANAFCSHTAHPVAVIIITTTFCYRDCQI